MTRRKKKKKASKGRTKYSEKMWAVVDLDGKYDTDFYWTKKTAMNDYKLHRHYCRLEVIRVKVVEL